MAHILGSPHLVLAHIGNIHGIGAGHIAHLANDLVGLERGLAVFGLVVLCLPLGDLGEPFFMLGLAYQRQQGTQHHSGIAHDREGHRYIFIHLAGIDIDLHDLGIGRKLAGV